MAYYYNDEGDKVPVDDHSTQAEKDKAVADMAKDAQDELKADNPGHNASGQTTEEAKRAAEASAKAAAEANAKRVYLGHFQYGGWDGGAHEASNRYNQLGKEAQARPGEVIDYGNANQARDLGLGARQSQVSMANLMQARARGQVPSIAQMQADRQMQQATAAQSSAAASARGAAGLALAQQGAAANTANVQSQISNQAQINAAQERLAAEQAAFGAASTMRGGDAALQGQDADQAKAQAAINAAQRAQNDAYQLGMTGYEVDVNKAHLGAQGNQVAIETGATNAANNLAAQQQMHSEDRTDKYIGMAAAGLAAAGGIAATIYSGGRSDALPGTSGVGGSSNTSSGGGGGGGVGGAAGDITDPGGEAAGGSVGGGSDDPDNPVSDKRAKDVSPWGEMVRSSLKRKSSGDGANVVSLYEPAGKERHWDRDVSQAVQPDVTSGASLSGPAPKYSRATPDAEKVAAKSEPSKAQKLVEERKLSDAELKRKGDEMLAAQQVQAQAALAAGPAVGGQQAPPEWLRREMEGTAAIPLEERAARLKGYPGAGSMVSDDRAKLAQAWDEGHNEALSKFQDYRMLPPDQLKALTERGNRIAASVRGTKADAWDEARGQNQSVAMQILKREPTSFTRETPMAESNRALEAKPYTYKPEFAAVSGQQPGEQNVGPMAQRMARNPVAGTAVEKDPRTGLLTLDRDKLAKVTAGGVADLQQQVDGLKSVMARRVGAKR